MFSPSEAGKKFKVAISLFGEDKVGDDEAAGFSLNGPQPLYTFGFGSAPLLRKYKLITAQAGEQSVTEPSREIDKAVFDKTPELPKPSFRGW